MMPSSVLQIYLWPHVTVIFDVLHPCICAGQVWLKVIRQFSRYIAERNFVTDSGLV